MPYALKIAGHAGPCVRRHYEWWLEVQDLDFAPPMSEKQAATFTISKWLGALSGVFSMKAADGSAFRYVRLHAVDEPGSDLRIRFDRVQVTGFTIEGRYEPMKERVTFTAERWRAE